MKCKFCEIAAGKREREHVLYQDKNHIAVLDLFPVYSGQCFIIPKKHIGGLEIFNLANKEYSDLLVFAKTVGKLIEKALHTKFICLVLEGTGVDHLHIKLYPITKIKKWAEKAPHKIEPYKGYLSTWLGARAKESDLLRLAKKIKIAVPKRS